MQQLQPAHSAPILHHRPKGSPAGQTPDRISGSVQASQNSSPAMKDSNAVCNPGLKIRRHTIVGFAAAHSANRAHVHYAQAAAERKVSADQVIARLRGKCGSIGATLFMAVCAGPSRSAAARARRQFQYTCKGSLDDLNHWSRSPAKIAGFFLSLRDVNRSADKGLKHRDHRSR